ncbi:MAG: RNA ligase [Mesotoga sp.]|nr:RNA ligase [Mesotoga sp.]
MRMFKKDVIDSYGDKVIINSFTLNDITYYKLNYSDKVGIGNFIDSDGVQSSIFNHLRGSVCILEDGYYKVIYPAMDKFFNLHELEKFDPELSKKITLKTAVEKLDGMMILPYVVEGEVYLSSRWNFDTIPVIVANRYLTEEYKKFILDCYNKKIYLTFEIISSETQIKVIYPESKYGLYLVSSQDKFGHMYPLIKEDDSKYYVQSDYNRVEIPKEIKHAEVYNISKLSELSKFISSFEGIEFEGVVAFTSGMYPFKLKNINYITLSRSKNRFIDEFADAIIDNKVDDIPNLVKDSYLFKTVMEGWESFNKDIDKIKDELKMFNSKKEIGIFIQYNNVPSLYNILFNLFDGTFDKEKKRKYFKKYLKDNNYGREI